MPQMITAYYITMYRVTKNSANINLKYLSEYGPSNSFSIHCIPHTNFYIMKINFVD
jgi:hypothetical protein